MTKNRIEIAGRTENVVWEMGETTMLDPNPIIN